MRYLALILFVLAGSAAASCPDPMGDSARISATGPALIAPQSWSVLAEGEESIPCQEWQKFGPAHGEMEGYLPIGPSITFDLEGMAPHILMVMAEAACDPRLVVRSADGLWHFGESANGREEVVVWGAPDGPLQVWLGAATPTVCDGTVTLETFDR